MPRTLPASPDRPFPLVLASHAGYACEDRKTAVFPAGIGPRFVLQDMGVHAKEALGEFEDWAPVFEGPLVPGADAFGPCLVGDFSAWTTPGIYRLVVAGTDARSVHFPVHDGVLSPLPRLLLDSVHRSRCGDFEDDTRGPCHLDDGVLSGTGVAVDATGGWHDAGDTRKWMVHTLAPILGFSELRRRLGWRPGAHWAAAPWDDDLADETAWGAAFALRMQDDASGMIREDVGGGGGARLAATRWWYENHSGCGGDNSENRFTDNVRGSGDERHVREQYNPIVQYVNVTVLCRAATLVEPRDRGLAARCREAARRAWAFVRGRRDDAFHGWTSVRSWRVHAALELAGRGLAAADEPVAAVAHLLDLADPSTAFFLMDTERRQPYRGILHSAQPLLALTAFAEAHPDHALADVARRLLATAFRDYVEPLRSQSPFGIVPYGLYRDPPRTRDRYRPWREGLFLRFLMPDDSETRINHGLGGHWTSWAHALAAGGRLLGDPAWREAALDQLHWMFGANPFGASFVGGVGLGHPLPHSSFDGVRLGGVMIGPRGTTDDQPFADLEMRCDWGSTEYWILALANMLQALAHLLPERVPAGRKPGRRVR
jgi:hypothetical protein